MPNAFAALDESSSDASEHDEGDQASGNEASQEKMLGGLGQATMPNAFAALDESSSDASEHDEGDQASGNEASQEKVLCGIGQEAAGDCSASVTTAFEQIELTSNRRPLYDYYCVIDFECTCDEPNVRPHEIIEFPAVVINSKTLQEEFCFHRYVRPTENPRLSRFCREFTGITQDVVDEAEPLEKVLAEFHQFCYERLLVGPRQPGRHQAVEFDCSSMCIATDGPWDVCKFLRPECERKKLLKLPAMWDRVCDIRNAYHYHFNMRGGVQAMLAHAGLKFQGREHSGIDDTRNIARLICRLLNNGVDLKADRATANWKEYQRRS